MVRGAFFRWNGAYFSPNIAFNSAILVFDNGMEDLLVSPSTNVKLFLVQVTTS